MRILVLGDFAGDGAATGAPAGLVGRRPVPIDIDGFDAATTRLAPRIRWADAAGSASLDLRNLDDFHPDILYRRLDIFAEYRALRARLLDPSSFAATAAEMKRAAQTPTGEGLPAKAREEDEGALLARLFGPRPDAANGVAEGSGGGDAPAALIHAIAGRHVLPAIEAEQTLLLAVVDDALSQAMRHVLHDPVFQAQEARWRGLRLLANGVDAEGDVRIGLLNVSRADLEADLLVADSVSDSWLCRLLLEDAAEFADGGAMLLVGAFSVALSAADIRLLSALGDIVATAGGVLLAEATPAWLGCRTAAELAEPRDWPPLDAATEGRLRALRRSPAARSIGLALPRPLLRLPYGARTDPIESFTFEELPGGTPAGRDAHERLLWGNPAYACAMVLAVAGRANAPHGPATIHDLPAYTYADTDGESALMPCAEVFLADRAVDAILARGPMPLQSHRHGATVRIPRLQSIRDPATYL